MTKEKLTADAQRWFNTVNHPKLSDLSWSGKIVMQWRWLEKNEPELFAKRAELREELVAKGYVEDYTYDKGPPLVISREELQDIRQVLDETFNSEEMQKAMQAVDELFNAEESQASTVQNALY